MILKWPFWVIQKVKNAINYHFCLVRHISFVLGQRFCSQSIFRKDLLLAYLPLCRASIRCRDMQCIINSESNEQQEQQQDNNKNNKNNNKTTTRTTTTTEQFLRPFLLRCSRSRSSSIQSRGDCEPPCFDQLNAHILERLLFCWHSKMCACSWSKHGRSQSLLAYSNTIF